MSKETRFACAVILLSVLYVIVFHFFVYPVFSGWPLVLLFSLIVISLIFFRAFHGGRQNLWAYAFLGPIILVSAAELLYSNGIMRFFGLIISALSLSFLSFWLLSPRLTQKQVKSFWTPSWFIDTFVPLTHKGAWSRLSLGKSGRQVFVGILVAVPITLIFLALFLSADPLIWRVISDALNIQRPGELIFRLIFDAFLALYFARVLWYAVTRMLHERMPRWNEYAQPTTNVLYITLLSILNVLFLVFIGFQFVYFFGGQAIIESYGLTYADYARQGFFQLFTASVIIFAVLYLVKWHTRMRSLAVRLLSLGLILQSWVVIASAMRRLSLYIDAYGMTDARYWAFAGLVIAALALLVMVIWIVAGASFSSFSKTLVMGSLYLFSAMLLVNVEAITVQWNADRKPTESVAPDYLYPAGLSTDAMPAYVSWLKSVPDDTPLPCSTFQGRLGNMILTSFRADEEKFSSQLFDQYVEASEGRVPLRQKEVIMQNFRLGYVGYVYRDPVYNTVTARYDYPDDKACQLKDWKNALRIFGTELQEQRLKDLRVSTWSEQRALEALKSL